MDTDGDNEEDHLMGVEVEDDQQPLKMLVTTGEHSQVELIREVMGSARIANNFCSLFQINVMLLLFSG